MPDPITNRVLQEYALKLAARQKAQEQTPEDLSQSIQGNLQELGVDPSAVEPGPSILSRTFDILSRPLYGVAEATSDIITGEDNPLEGFAQGFSGKEKTTFSKVLGELGLEGPYQGAFGLALDIGLDPLTYVGGGIVKGGISKAAAETAAGKVASKTLALADKPNSQLVKKAVREFQEASIGKGLTKAEYKAGRKAAIREAAETAAYESAQKVKDAKLAASKGRVQLRVLGKPVAESESLYRAGRKAADLVSGSSIGGAFNKAFRPAATLKDLHPLKRVFESQGVANAERAAKVFMNGGNYEGYVMPAFKHLTAEEAARVSKAIEHGTQFGDELAESGELLSNYVIAAKDIIRLLGENEEVLGLIRANGLIDNYLPHYFDYKKSDPLSVSQFEAARKDEIKKLIDDKIWDEANDSIDLGPVTTSKTLDEAIEEGLVPIDDIRDVLASYIRESFVKQGRARWNLAAASEFGVDLGKNEKLAKKLGLVKMSNKYLDGLKRAGHISEDVYFPREISDALRQMDKIFYDEAAGAGLLRLYDKVLSTIKFGQTVVNPGHHIRNLMSDMFLNFLDGVTNFAVYVDSFKTLKQVRKWDLDPTNFIDPNPVKFKIGKLKNEVDGLQLYDMYIRHGARSGYFREEIAKVGFRPAEKIREISEQREDFVRFAHFLDAIQKEGAQATSVAALEKAAQKAAARVRKFNIDYGDLTPFEQRTMKRVIPFYTWLRKNAPLQIENMFLRPGRQMVTPKIIRNLQVALGEEQEMDVLGINALPNYMRDAMSVKIIGEGEGRNAKYWDPGAAFPLLDLGEILGHGPEDTVRNIISRVTQPALMPVEEISGYSFFKGRQDDTALSERLATMLPAGRLAYTNFATDQPMGTRILNYFLTPGVSELSPGQIQGELRRQEDIVQEMLRKRREIQQASAGT